MKSPRPTKKELVTAFRTREILGAARELIGPRGVEAVTMEEIAQAAGVAKGTLYLYFPSKDELIRALISQVGENLYQEMQAILALPQSPPEKLRRVLALLLNKLEREQVLFPLYMREMQRSRRDTGRPQDHHILELEERIMGQLNGLFAEGMARGQFMAANPRLMTFLLRGLVRAVGYYQMAVGRESVMNEVLPVLATLLFSGLTRKSQETEEGAHV